jgi:hypothetical protein
LCLLPLCVGWYLLYSLFEWFLHFCMVADQVYVPWLFVLSFIYYIFLCLKKNLEILFSQFQNIRKYFFLTIKYKKIISNFFYLISTHYYKIELYLIFNSFKTNHTK